jgi:lactate permease
MIQVWAGGPRLRRLLAIPQFLISNYVNPWIVDIGAYDGLDGVLIGFLKVWHPRRIWTSPALRTRDESSATMPPPPAAAPRPTTREVWFGLAPWIIVCVILLIWGTNAFKFAVNPYTTWNYRRSRLDNMINKVAPVVAKPTPEAAVSVHLPLLHRHRHADRGDHFRLRHGLLAGEARRRIRPHHQDLRLSR